MRLFEPGRILGNFVRQKSVLVIERRQLCRRSRVRLEVVRSHCFRRVERILAVDLQLQMALAHVRVYHNGRVAMPIDHFYSPGFEDIGIQA